MKENKVRAARFAINDVERDFMRKNYLDLSVGEMAEIINRDTQTVYRFLNREGLPSLDKYRKKIVGVKEGMFNLKERENWLVGK